MTYVDLSLRTGLRFFAGHMCYSITVYASNECHQEGMSDTTQSVVANWISFTYYHFILAIRWKNVKAGAMNWSVHCWKKSCERHVLFVRDCCYMTVFLGKFAWLWLHNWRYPGCNFLDSWLRFLWLPGRKPCKKSQHGMSVAALDLSLRFGGPVVIVSTVFGVCRCRDMEKNLITGILEGCVASPVFKARKWSP